MIPGNGIKCKPPSISMKATEKSRECNIRHDPRLVHHPPSLHPLHDDHDDDDDARDPGTLISLEGILLTIPDGDQRRALILSGKTIKVCLLIREETRGGNGMPEETTVRRFFPIPSRLSFPPESLICLFRRGNRSADSQQEKVSCGRESITQSLPAYVCVCVCVSSWRIASFFPPQRE